MSKKLGNIDKAGRLVKLLGWIYILMFLGMALAVVIPFLYDGDKPDDQLPFFGILSVYSLGVSILFLIVGSSIKKNKKWAKITGVFLAILSLLFFPIGTVIGIFILYYLYNGWNETSHIAQENSHLLDNNSLKK